MKTRIKIMRPGKLAFVEVRDIDIPETPTYRDFFALLTPILDGGRFTHVPLLIDGKPRDVFIDEVAIQKGLPINDEASDLFTKNAGKYFPIFGTVVLFIDHQLWRS